MFSQRTSKTRLNDGYMDEDVGRELARSRAEVQHERTQREALIQDQQNQTQASASYMMQL